MVALPIWVVILAVFSLVILIERLVAVSRKCREFREIVKKLEGEVEEERESGSGGSEGES